MKPRTAAILGLLSLLAVLPLSSCEAKGSPPLNSLELLIPEPDVEFGMKEGEIAAIRRIDGIRQESATDVVWVYPSDAMKEYSPSFFVSDGESADNVTYPRLTFKDSAMPTGCIQCYISTM